MTFFFLMNKDKYIEREQKKGLNSSFNFLGKKKTLGEEKRWKWYNPKYKKQANGPSCGKGN